MIPVLYTRRLTLRPYAPGEASAVQRLAGIPEVALTTTNIPYPYEDGMAEEWISSHQPRWEARQAVTLAITTEADGVVGTVGLQLKLEHQQGELGYWVGLPYWNQGYATEASAALIDFGFAELSLHRIQSRHFVRNPASGRVMEKAGMKFEGILRQHALVRGEFEDVAMYSILASDV